MTSRIQIGESPTSASTDKALTVHHLIRRAKSVLDELEPCWVRVRVSEFAPLEGGEHCRVVIHPIELTMGRSNSLIAPTWEGRLWRKDRDRLQAFIQCASDDGVEFDALVRIDVNSRAGLVLVIEDTRDGSRAGGESEATLIEK